MEHPRRVTLWGIYFFTGWISFSVLGLFLLLDLANISESVTEFCNPNKSSGVYRFTTEACPYGVLFVHPFQANCFRSAADNDQANFYEDLCDNVIFDSDKSKRIQLIGSISEGLLSDTDSCKGPDQGQCDVKLHKVHKSEFTQPGEDTMRSAEDNYDAIPEVEERRSDKSVLEQTFRLFRFLTGLDGDQKLVSDSLLENYKEMSEGSDGAIHHDWDGIWIAIKSLLHPKDTTSGFASNNPDEALFALAGPKKRIVELFKQSVRVAQKHCDNAFVPQKFSLDIGRAFLFLLRENEDTQLKDVSQTDYDLIKAALDSCFANPTPFKLSGKACGTSPRVHLITKNGKAVGFSGNEWTHKSYKHDVPVDAAWGILDFVHGLCFGNFKEHVNTHHLFQRGIEGLFNDGLVYRWNRPPTLPNEGIWDNMLSANVWPTMKNLDGCIQAAYFDTPFLHRLERPFLSNFLSPQNDHIDDKNSLESKDSTSQEASHGASVDDRRRRRKRSVTVFLEDYGMSEAGWCFQSEYRQRKVVREYLLETCPNSPALAQWPPLPVTTPHGDVDSTTTQDPSLLEQDQDPQDNSRKIKIDINEKENKVRPKIKG